MKVLLLEHPRGRSARHFNTIAHTPLSSSLLSGYLFSLLRQHGIQTELHDSTSHTDDFSSTVEAVAGIACDILGVHLIYSWDNTPRVLEMLGEIAARRDVPIIAYGFYPSFAGDYLLTTCPFIEGVIRGEPEMTFLELCSITGTKGDWSRVKGFACRQGKGYAASASREVIRDLDVLPFPHRTPAGLARSGGTILGSRGCYGSCSFCHINDFYGVNRLWRGRSPENIYAEVKELLPLLEEKYIYFLDANFFGPGSEGQGRAEKIAECLEGETGLTFGLECRANDVRKRSLGRLAQAGLRDVFLGIESGSQGCLDRMKKKTTVEVNARAVALLRDFGIDPHIGFIMFEPDSDIEDLRSNFSFLKSNNLLRGLTRTVDLLYHPEIVLMGTGTYTRLRNDNRLEPFLQNPYHGDYGFKDGRVEICADIFFSICRYLLNLMDRSDSPLYWRELYANGGTRPAVGTAGVLNGWLISLFEEVLRRLESDPGSFNREGQNRFIHEAHSYIDSALSIQPSARQQEA